MMGTLTAHRYCRNQVAPRPPRKDVVAMVRQIEEALKEIGFRPTRVRCESWRVPAASIAPGGHVDFVAKLSVDCEPGEQLEPLITWYEWQHPHWHWSDAPMPTVVPGQETVALG